MDDEIMIAKNKGSMCTFILSFIILAEKNLEQLGMLTEDNEQEWRWQYETQEWQ